MNPSEIETRLATGFLETHAADAAAVLEARNPGDVASLLAEVEPAPAAVVLRQMVAGRGAACVLRMDARKAAKILGELPANAVASLLRGLSPEERESVLGYLRVDDAASVRRLLAYPSGTAGAVMDPDPFVVAADTRVRAAVARLRRDPRKALYYVYVVDRDQRLVGVLTLRELMLADRDLPVVSVMTKDPVAVAADASHLDVLAHPAWRRFHAVPVVDAGGALLGVIRYETFRHIENELTGDSKRQTGLDLVVSLSELYAKGLSGLVTGIFPRGGQGKKG